MPFSYPFALDVDGAGSADFRQIFRARPVAPPPVNKLPVEGPADHYLTADAVAALRAEIADAGGVEVFFVGRRNTEGLIVEVEAHAYGSSNRVPAILHAARPGDVILHNHPSGDLRPSEADLDISSIVGQSGIGSYIVTNDASRVRMIVAAADARTRVRIDPEWVNDLLGPKSEVAAALGDYEDRPAQREMARAVTEALNNDGIAVVEAGTGTGKSLAYLVPALLHALENGEKIVVSTATINLQEQIMNKDLPMVRRALDREFAAVLVKGRSNYVCKRKAQQAREEMEVYSGQLIEEENREELRGVLEWIAKTPSGDRGELPVPPRAEVWERVGSEADNCLRVRCPFYETCFFYNSRREAARADLLVVNHSLLLSDLAVRRESGNWTTAAVLPPVDRVILDEAHHLEEIATEHFGAKVSRIAMRRAFGRLLRYDGKARHGLIPRLENKIAELNGEGSISWDNESVKALLLDVIPLVDPTREAVEHLLDAFAGEFLDIAGLEPPRRGLDHKVRLVPAMTHRVEWAEQLAPRLESIAGELATFVSLCQGVIEGFAELNDKARAGLRDLAMEFRSQVERLDGARRTVLSFLRDDDKMCRWVELSEDRRGHMAMRLCMAPVSVAGTLREALHDRAKSEILTSATLTVDRSFDFLFDRIGLKPPTMGEARGNDENNGDRPAMRGRPVSTLRLEAPFDYGQQVFFGVPTDLGDPRERAFDERLGDFVLKATRVSGGRALVLFTSAGQMRRLHQQCAGELRRRGLVCLLQGEESRDRLLQKFRDDETSVLFATSSFWEGIDVKGRALELLIIAKLPFSVPNDPIQEAQYEALEREGRDPFNGLSLPRAVIRLRQGFGRLVRAKTDRGAVLVCDDRLVSKGYGRRFLVSLPKIDLARGGTVDVLRRYAEFAGQPAPV